MRNTKNKRGFTIVEVVIAMAVVVVVSAVAITTIVATRKSEVQLLRDLDTVRVAENILECFKATDDDAFWDLVSKVEGVEKDEIKDGEILSKRYGYKTVIKLENLENKDKLAVSMYDEDGKPLLSFEYTKYTKGGAE